MNDLFTGNNDKLNALASVLLYIYRCDILSREYSKPTLLEYIGNIRSKNADVNEMKNIIKSMINEKLQKVTLTDLLTLNLPEDSKIVTRLLKLLNEEMSTKDLTDYVSMMQTMIYESSNLLTVVSSVNATSFNLNTKDMSVEEQVLALSELRTSLTALDHLSKDSGNVGDGSIMESVSVTDGEVEDNLNQQEDGSSIALKLGWDKLNKGVGGHLNTGQLVAIEAMQHKNKTGFTLSLFLQTMLNNKIELAEGLKPVWLWISLEDDLKQVLPKIFIYLYFRDHGAMPDMLEVTNKTISNYIKETIEALGIRLELKRIDGFKFSIDKYESICSSYEMRGMKVVVTGIDYLEKAYTDGTQYNTGATGSGLKNMFTVFRTYVQRNDILLMTPHQFSTAANDLLRDGTSDVDFLKRMVGKNYTQGSRGLSQEFDVEILIHLCTIAGISYQVVQVGKVKGVSYVNAKDKFMMIPFEDSEAGNSNDLAPLMEDCSATNPIKTDNDEADTIDL